MAQSVSSMASRIKYLVQCMVAIRPAPDLSDVRRESEETMMAIEGKMNSTQDSIQELKDIMLRSSCSELQGLSFHVNAPVLLSLSCLSPATGLF